MRCELSPLAQADLREIGDHIARDNPARAESFVDELLERGQRLLNMPTAYRARPELALGLRSCVHGRYILFFRVTDTGIRIERIMHSSRDIGPAAFDPGSDA
jgi:toxin ParE1/3/4